MRLLPLHEAAHENDWKDKSLTPLDRAKLFADIIDRVHAPDRFKSINVEKMPTDTEIRRYKKVAEYWAWAFEAYVTGDRDLPAKDRQIFEDYFRKNDPDYNVDEARNACEAIVENEKIVVQLNS